MAKFRVMLEGENLWVRLDREPQHLGFFTTRFVEAADPDEAARRAVDLVRGDLRDRLLNAPDDSPRVVVDEIVEVARFPSDVELPGHGYTWYLHEESQP